ncbi:MAG: fasciclin domain-containing protein [Solirubrobacterales bacterium]
MLKRTFPLIACLVVLALGLAACGDDADDAATNGATTSEQTTGAATPPRENAVQVAQGNTNLSTLVEALTVAELAKTLEGPGPYTVFAPTNAAFEALGGTLNTLLKPANQDELAEILTYHVVPGELTASELGNGQMLETIQGDSLEVKIDGEEVTVNGATVQTPDVDASNGVVHVIDEVLTPPEG